MPQTSKNSSELSLTLPLPAQGKPQDLQNRAQPFLTPDPHCTVMPQTRQNQAAPRFSFCKAMHMLPWTGLFPLGLWEQDPGIKGWGRSQG